MGLEYEWPRVCLFMDCLKDSALHYKVKSSSSAQQCPSTTTDAIQV
jgi:hypothetical protein